MAATISFALARLRRSGFDDLPLKTPVEQLCRELGHTWRDRVFTPLVTLRLFLLQVLHANTAINHLRQLSGLCFSAGSYCEARMRLPLVVLQQLLQKMVDTADGLVRVLPESSDRIYLVDGSSFSMPDTKALQDHFGMTTAQKPGVGYPLCTIMGMIDLASGLITRMLALPVYTHDMRGVIGLHESLQKGDILVGDRAFCSFCHFAILNLRGVLGCFRLHQRRPTDRTGIVRWEKPQSRPKWMSLEQFVSMPSFALVRIIRHPIVQHGFRTKVIFIATTLKENEGWSDQKVIDLYARRWEIETCFGHLKTTMKMSVLKCKTVEGVMKELCVYLIVYNLVRLRMLEYARSRGIDLRRVSFIDTLRFLAARAMGLEGVEELIINPRRHGRQQLRVIRRRKKNYDLLTCPRNQWENRRKLWKCD